MLKNFVCGLALASGALAAAPGVSDNERVLIDEFMKNYEASFASLTDATHKASLEMKKALDTAAFMVHPDVAFRTKDPKSLRQKLLERAEEKDYQSFNDIEDDICDIIGVRIIYYAPALDHPVVEGILKKNFKNLVHARVPTPSYPAHNYRALVDVGGKEIKVEIQARGALQHAMLQVNHRFVYKVKPEFSLDGAEMKEWQAYADSVQLAAKQLDEFLVKWGQKHANHQSEAGAESRFAAVASGAAAAAEEPEEVWHTLPGSFPDLDVDDYINAMEARVAVAQRADKHGDRKLLRSN